MADLFDGQPVSLTEMLSEVVREIGMRESVYPRQVASVHLADEIAAARAETATAPIYRGRKDDF